MEVEPRDFRKIFLRFWQFKPHFLINFFLIKNVYSSCWLHCFQTIKFTFYYHFRQVHWQRDNKWVALEKWRHREDLYDVKYNHRVQHHRLPPSITFTIAPIDYFHGFKYNHRVQHHQLPPPDRPNTTSIPFIEKFQYQTIVAKRPGTLCTLPVWKCCEGFGISENGFPLFKIIIKLFLEVRKMKWVLPSACFFHEDYWH